MNIKKSRAALVGFGITAVIGGSVFIGITAAGASGTPSNITFQSGGIEKLIKDRASAPGLSGGEKEILAEASRTGHISETAYDQAHNQYAACMTEKGFSPSFRQSSKGYMIELPYENVEPAALDKATTECANGTNEIRGLYRLQVANPQLIIDSRVVAVNCLQSVGTVDGSYTAERFEQDWHNSDYPFDPMDNKNNDCLYDAGYALFW